MHYKERARNAKRNSSSIVGRGPISSADPTAKADTHVWLAGGALQYVVHCPRSAAALRAALSRMATNALSGNAAAAARDGTSTCHVPDPALIPATAPPAMDEAVEAVETGLGEGVPGPAV